MLQTTTYLFFNACRVFALVRLLSSILQEKRVAAAQFWLIPICYFIVNSTLFLLFENAMVNLGLMFVFFICLCECFAATLQRKILAIVCAVSLSMIYETALFAVFIKVIGTQNMSAFVQVALVLLIWLTANIAEKTNQSSSDEKLGRLYWMLIICMPVGSIAILALLYTVALDSWQCALISVILLVFNICIIYVYNLAVQSMERERQSETLRFMNQAYHMQLETIQNANHKASALRHDMKNHILAIQTLQQAGQVNALEDYLKRFQSELEVDRQWVNTQNLAFDSFVNYKLFQIQKLGTTIHCTVRVEDVSQFDVFDLSAVLGNIFDNAYEALQSTICKRLDFEMKTEKSILYIVLTNTTDREIVQQNNIVATSKSNQKEHGFGLQNIQKIVEKYQGVFKLSQDANQVTVRLMLYPRLEV